ncbi:MAG: hypothetical protein US50_C0019G0010 [Candidatus Nomurabacteria bacterium GW2011_GWB1_37_5]|uniref:Uncharacterized protein n=1 Tax=Candidatus Nomurabacteria bacterium GW2011_GWB1_37_5 TaxID=1618742 RepID=A0A0G0GWC0_9BACT|nr:MAG: hypothetical protein US50_C0019G0010 [Candidatus Nomurabacteria bacterium GW2011_GWB1_37_5]
MSQCQFIKQNNEKCEANAMTDKGYCFTHNPETKGAKQLAVIKGGKSPKKNYNPLSPIEISDSRSVVNLLATTINEVRQGKADLRVANCIGYLAGHLIKALEVSELEGRLETVEKVILERRTMR